MLPAILIDAIILGDVGATRLLLEAGAAANSAALDYAQSTGNPEITRLVKSAIR